MNNLKKYNLGFFMTEKMSLAAWDQAGILSREIAPYNILADYFHKIYLFSYGDASDLRYKNQLAFNIEIAHKNTDMKIKYYNWLLPFIHWRKIKSCHFIKTNQLKSRAALLVKIFKPSIRFILRTGYTASLFEMQQAKLVAWRLKLWEKIAYYLCNIGLVTSAGDKKYLITTYGLSEEKIIIVPNYIDTELFSPQNQEKYSDRIIYVGRLAQQKNLNNLITALSGTNIGLDIVSGFSDHGEQSTMVESLVYQAGTAKVSLRFLGKIPNQKLPDILNKYSIFVLPSLYEGMPKALLEAMSCSLACIATDVLGNRELIDDENTGLLCRTTAESLRKAILRLNNDQALQKNLGQHARKFVVDNFSLQTQIKKEISIYEQLA